MMSIGCVCGGEVAFETESRPGELIIRPLEWSLVRHVPCFAGPGPGLPVLAVA